MTILFALLLDLAFGEPPARLHPVVWMGRYLDRVGARLPEGPPGLALLAGGGAWATGAAVTLLVAGLAGWAVGLLPGLLEAAAMALLLKPMFALRLLFTEVAAVETALEQSLEAGRARLANLVSRDTSTLDAAGCREAALESLAENLSDSLVAPLFWFLLLGLPGAALYRFANTADAMWGYRGRWEWAGKVAARADDLLNLVPARLTGLALLGRRVWAPGALASLATEARRTPSPNGGWPMAAMAMALGLRLGKPGVYVLNLAGATPGPGAVRQGLQRAALAAGLLVLLAALIEVLLHG